MTLCSVLIPSRARPDRLRKTIRSIWETSDAGRVEILVRFDSDDELSLGIVTELARDGVRVVVGPRGRGYLTLAVYYEELARIAAGAWIWVMNDDAHIMGHDGRWPPCDLAAARGWDARLAEIPLVHIVQPEMYKLGGSGYLHCDGGAFPLVPNGAWRSFGEPHLCEPIDTWLDVILHQRGNWQTRFLKGVAVVHDRDTADVLEEHRRIS